MPPTNSLGVGPPKQRTINVEVNLLAEWLESRGRIREDRLRWTVVLITMALVGILTVPFLSEYAANAERRAHRAEQIATSKQTVLAGLQQQQSVVQPGIDGEATLVLCQARSRLFMGHLLAVLNVTTPSMAMESVEASVLGGELTVRAKAQSESYAEAQEYVATSGQGENVKSAILTTARPNPALDADGVTFEFAKKVEVGQ